MLEDVLRSLFREPVTERKPGAAPARLRGRLRWTPEGCTGCALCVKDCSANALELIRLDDRNKRYVLRYSVDRCTYCGQCVENCRFDCLKMAGEAWSLSAPKRGGFTVYYGDDADVERVLAERGVDGDSSPEALAEDRRNGNRS
jgi:formate hydrogenlyase subunit 6/NADH:ubiquinone oxidoreductase subunit I